jgi:hypothetical protein
MKKHFAYYRPHKLDFILSCQRVVNIIETYYINLYAQNMSLFRNKLKSDVMVHTYNPSTQESEAGGSQI